MAAAQAGAARTRSFTASYAGTASGHVSGKTAAGSASLPGRGRPIGRGSLTGSGSGTFTSSTCLTFSGRVTLSGGRGSLRLRVRNAQACASAGNASRVSFSGKARVVGGTSAFAGARGMLSFSGTYARPTGAVSVSFRGRITY